MKITALELSIIVDALRGSLAISDNKGLLFNYTQESREKVLMHVLDIMRGTTIDTDKDNNTAESSNGEDEAL